MQLTPGIKAASDASMAAQSRLLWATRIQLCGLVLAAAGGVLTATLNAVWPTVVSVLAFSLAFGATAFVTATRPERTWYDGRAAAESLKTLAWRYAVGGSPYGLEEADERTTDERFVKDISEVIQALPYAQAAEDDAGAQISEEMRSVRGRPLAERRTEYERGRIADQQGWYGRKASFNEKRGRQWALALIALEVLGFGFGIAEISGMIRVDLLGLVAAIGGAITAWFQTKQHDSLARAYAVAAQELSAIRSLISHQTTEADWGSFVNESEEAISREHTLWRASRGVVMPDGVSHRRRGRLG